MKALLQLTLRDHLELSRDAHRRQGAVCEVQYGLALRIQDWRRSRFVIGRDEALSIKEPPLRGALGTG